MAKEKSRTEKLVQSLGGNDIRSDFNTRFGEGTFFTFDDNTKASVTPIPTGIPSVDYASGIGGLPGGRIIEIYGPESSGKTSAALMCIAEFQKLSQLAPSIYFGKKAAYIDAEHALDPIHVKNLGVDTSQATGMLVNQPDSGEQAFDIMEAICLSNQFGICIVDSVASLVPMAETEHGMDYNPIGLQARMMSQGLRKLKGLAYKHNVMFIFINQIRSKVGVMYGNPETTPGGQALKFYASVRIDVRSKFKEIGGEHVGLETKMKFVKNKVARPLTVAEYDYYWIGGVDKVKNIMNVAIDMDIIHKRGAYYFFGPDPEDSKNVYADGNGNLLKWQGKDALENTLKASPELYQYTYDLVMGNIPRDTQFIHEEDDEPIGDELSQLELETV